MPRFTRYQKQAIINKSNYLALVRPSRIAKLKWRVRDPFAKKVLKVIKRNSELKHYTVTLTGAVVAPGLAYNLVMTDVPQVAAGAAPTDTTRIGDKITITSLHIRAIMTIDPDAGNAPASLVMRCVVYQYKPNNGLIAPAQNRLFVNDNTGAPGPLSHQNIDHMNDYHIIYDSTRTMSNLISAGTGTVPDKGIQVFNFWVPMKRIKKQLQYDATTIAHNNGLYLAFFNNSTGVGDPTVDVQTRLRFLDG